VKHPIARWIAYAAIQAALLAAYTWAVSEAGHGRAGGAGAKGLLSEDRWVEWSQLFVLAIPVVFCASAFRSGGPATLRVLAGLAACAMVRELDHVFEVAWGETAPRVALGVAVTALFWLVVASRARLARELPGFVSSPGFLFLFFGVTLVAIYAQLLGQREVWQALTGQGKVSLEKRFVEEGLELLGYVVIACGVFEERFFGAARMGRSSAG